MNTEFLGLQVAVYQLLRLETVQSYDSIKKKPLKPIRAFTTVAVSQSRNCHLCALQQIHIYKHCDIPESHDHHSPASQLVCDQAEAIKKAELA